MHAADIVYIINIYALFIVDIIVHMCYYICTIRRTTQWRALFTRQINLNFL